MKKEMLINVAQPEECRIAIVEDGILEELYVERSSQDNYVGNIYKGRIVNLEPSIQAAFVDFGVGRNGFLHISDVESQYFRQGGYDPSKLIQPGEGPPSSDDDEEDWTEDGPVEKSRNGRGGTQTRKARPGVRPRVKPPIQEIFKRGDEVLVQVIKEGIGTKGPTLSTYISIPGRYLVLMPALGRIGVSRKIEDDDDRRRLRDILRELNPPKGFGFIVRTAGTDRTKKELSRDLAYLLRLWKVIVRRIKKTTGPVDIYEESDMIIRTIRDIFSNDVDAIVIDEPQAHERAKEFLQIVMPRYASRLSLYEGKEPLFHKNKLDEEIARIHQRQVPLQRRRFDCDRSNRSSGGDRREQRQFPHRWFCRRVSVPAQSDRRQGNRSATSPPRPGRSGRQRLYRHAERTPSSHRRTHSSRRRPTRPSPNQDPEDQSVWSDRNDPPADPSQPAPQRLPGVSRVQWFGPGQECREHGDRSNPQAADVCPQRADRPGFSPGRGERGQLPQQPKRRELTRMEDEYNLQVQILSDEDASPEFLRIECEDASGREIRFTE